MHEIEKGERGGKEEEGGRKEEVGRRRGDNCDADR